MEDEGEEEENEQLQSRRHGTYPSVFPISVTHTEFPSSSATLDRSGMPYGCLLTPFISRADAYTRSMRRPESATQVARCSACKAYMNPFCDFAALQWTCSLCSSRNAVTRSMSRYRQGDFKTLEEAQCILVDYPQPFRTLDGCPSGLDGKLGVQTSQRPLVHVLLIQESMAFESLQCLVESLCEVLGTIHPEVRLVLATFSHRLCIYSLDPQAPRMHCVSIINSASLEDETSAAAVATAAAATHNPAHDYRTGKGIKGRFVDLVPQRPLASAIDFFDAACPLGVCQETMSAALQHIHEAFALETSEEQQRAVAMEGDMEGDDETPEKLRGHHEYLYAPPEVMLGPALEAVQKWITGVSSSPQRHDRGGGDDDDEEEDEEERTGESKPGFASSIYNVLSSVSQGFMQDLLGTAKEPVEGLPRQQSAASEAHREQQQAADGHWRGLRRDRDRGKSAADHCSGVFLHVFISGPQDLPKGAHDSVPSSSAPVLDPTRDGGKKALEVQRPGMDRMWVQSLAEHFVKAAVCVNVWGVCNFDAQRLGLVALAPLAHFTGGSLTKTVLGLHPAREQLHLTEQLRRCLSSQQLASRGVVRLRFSPIVEFSDEGVTGHLKEDADYPGVYRIAGCTPTSTFAVQLAYKSSDSSLNPSERNNKLVIQMAFSYDTLIEGAPRPPELAEAEEEVDPAPAAMDYCHTAATILGLDAEMEALRARETCAPFGRRRPIKDSATSRAAITMHGVSGDVETGCAHDRSKSLMAVRRLRVFTVIVQCTHRIPRLIQVANHTTMAVLLARLACAKHAKLSLDAGSRLLLASPVASSSAAAMLESWAATLLAGHAVALKAVSESPTAALDQALSQSSLRRLLLMLYGAIHALDLHALLNSSSAVELAVRSAPSAAANPPTPRLSVCDTDSWLVLQSVLDTTESYHTFKMLYPTCHPLSAERCLINHNVPLTREAMTMSGAPAFLIDSGMDLVLYKTLPSAGRRPAKLQATVAALPEPTAAPEPPCALPSPAPPVHAIVTGIRALNVLARNQKEELQGEEVEEGEEEGEEEEHAQEQEPMQQEAQSPFDGLARDPDWLPSVLRRRLHASAIVPRIYHAEAGQASAAVLSSKLVEDAQERGLSSEAFLSRIKVAAAHLAN